MLISMTGYGKATCELGNKKLAIEIKSLNSKQFDLNTRLPGFYREKELEVRNLLAGKLERGKVDFTMYSEMSALENGSLINSELVKVYYGQLTKIAGDLNLTPSTELLSVVMRLPDVMKTEREELSDEEWQMIIPAINNALESVIAFRKQEGKALENDITSRILNIQGYLEKVEPLEKPRIARVKERIKTNLAEFIDAENIDKNRLEQELIFYVEKLDITEEKVRLSNHCQYFLKNMNNDEPVGRKLGFITQEMGREINTLGSKANDSDIQKLVIKMKDELEKIKEQLLNVL
jgi:uncharacterized protein (TIGR00255 family)